jgi:hypothetical protein
MKNEVKKIGTYKRITEELKNDKFFWGLIFFIFILHLLTYPSIHNISDEQLYLDVASRICKLNFSDFTGKETGRIHGPLYHTILCLTSPFHHFELGKAEIINFVFIILGIVGWYFSTPLVSVETRKRLILLLFANNLLWTYSFRVLIDISICMFLSLGLMNSYLFLEYKKKRNYYLTIIFISLASLTSEIAFMFIPILFVYLLLKKNKNILDWGLLILPFIPYGFYQLLIGFKDIWLYARMMEVTGMMNVSYIPYAHFPTIFYTIGVFGLGFISCVLAWKNMSKFDNMKNYFIFSLLIYLIWEIVFDFIASVNLPRYNMTLIPFLALMISENYEKDKKYRYLYYLTLIYSIMTGFIAAYYFHTSSLPIWRNQIIDITKIKIT